MKRLFTFLALVVLATPAALAQSSNGNNNGARVGKAGFLLNVSAFEQCPTSEFAGSNRRQIAVQADYTGVATDNMARVNKIFLSSGPGFQVQDGNACDETGAYVQLPIDAANCRNCSGPTVLAPTFRLLTVCVDKSGDGVCDDRIGLFDSLGEGYWWNFDTAGRPHVQLVLFAVPSSPSTSLN